MSLSDSWEEGWNWLESREKKTSSSSFTSFMQNSKATFYNLYRNYPRELPQFSDSDIYILGVRYTKKPNALHFSQDIAPQFVYSLPLPSPAFPLSSSPSSTPTLSSSPPSSTTSTSSLRNLQIVGGSTAPPTPLSAPVLKNGWEDIFSLNLSKLKEEKKRERLVALQKIQEDVQSRIWFSYRKDFTSLESSLITTDVGWSCMIRTGQMMLAQAFVVHFFTRDWRLSNRTPEQNAQYKEILSWFYDGVGFAFSLHSITSEALKNGHKLTDWHGPSSICRLLKILCARQPNLPFTVYVSEDGAVHEADLFNQESRDQTSSSASSSVARDSFSSPSSSPVSRRQSDPSCPQFTSNSTPSSPCSSSPSQPLPTTPPSTPTGGGSSEHIPSLSTMNFEFDWKPLVIFIPLRLGMTTLNPEYIPLLQEVLKVPQTIGIIGGRPRASHYFIGFQDSDVLFLDPHYVQPVSRDPTTYHASFPLKMPFVNIDPSLALGFYCRTRQSFLNLKQRMADINKLIDFGLFTFM